ISKCMALACRDFLSLYLPGKEIKIKWPNDILVSNKKICGILIENGIRSEQIDYTIVGIGININELPDADDKTSLKGLMGHEFYLKAIEYGLFNCLGARYEQ